MANYVDFEDDAATGINLTIAEGETSATSVAEVVADDLVEEEESFTATIADSENYLVDRDRNRVVNNLTDLNTSIDSPTTVFGTIEADTIEVDSSPKGLAPNVASGQLIFAGTGNDLIDTSVGSEGENRIYAGNGDDTLVLGGVNNTIVGGEGADQFWIASAQVPESTNTVTDFTLGEDVIVLQV